VSKETFLLLLIHFNLLFTLSKVLNRT